MDFDSLLVRTPVSDRPLSMLARLRALSAVGPFLKRAVGLLEGRRAGDEVVLILPSGDEGRLPCRVGGVRIRTIQHYDPRSGPALEAGFAACRQPTILMVDEEVSLTAAELKELTTRLDIADVVCGKRQMPRWSRLAPAAWLASSVFSSAVADPLCPIRAYRRSAVAGITLQSASPLLEFEAVAKMTFLVSLLDEVELDWPYRSPTVAQALIQQWGELGTLFFKPSFWKFAGLGTERPALHRENLPASTTSHHPDQQVTFVPMVSRSSSDWGPNYPRLARRSATLRR